MKRMRRRNMDDEEWGGGWCGGKGGRVGEMKRERIMMM